MVSLFGRFLINLDVFCHNLKIFIGIHEKTFEILFLISYIILQLILVFCFPDVKVSILVILLLFFLSLERIFSHIWLENESKKLKLKEKILDDKYNELLFYAREEIARLKNQIKRFKDKD